ncbi:MAG: excinuclease ABC subunit UvrA [Phycisphaerales bacterium]|jgi:excinuclease ABC subunit A|nr:excinuclease ABC subunit UvrA [Phycisphaerales bacterium]MBT7170574.1 excinuclease ABC subunit UvrA [Phycisphaerales bacterium]
MKTATTTHDVHFPRKHSGKEIVIIGAREHNLKGVHVRIPRDKLVVVTGLSGSGKSSLAFDTIYAEGQRKYVESLSAYARQFLDQLGKPDVEHIEGLPPTVAIEQRGGGSNPRSTVATTTEIYDYLRLLFARVGTPHCWICEREITSQSVSQIVDTIFDTLPEGTKFLVLAPIVRGQKGQHTELLAHMMREGFVRVRIDGEMHELKDHPKIAKTKAHTIEVVVDRLVAKPAIRTRLADSLQTAMDLSSGLVGICHEPIVDGEPVGGKIEYSTWIDQLYSATYACPDHPEVNLPELAPRMFSFNSPYGACKECDGLGTILEFDPELIVPDRTVTLSGGAIDAWRHGGKRMNILYNRMIRQFCRSHSIPPVTPYCELTKAQEQQLLHGDDDFEGVLPNLTRRWKTTDSEFVKARLHAYMCEQPCPACQGARLAPASLAVTIAGITIHDVTQMSITESHSWFDTLELNDEQARIAEMILREIRHRLTFLNDVGLGYITLNRTSATLSGGEAQRIRLATQVGSGLVGVCYVLDEPTIGLHQRDNERLIRTLQRLRDLGNTVIVVEHDEDTIRIADEVIDVGPGAGKHGGRIVAQGTLKQLMASKESVTGKYLSGEFEIESPEKRRKLKTRHCLQIKGCTEHNLKAVNVKIPTGGIVCVTGVSGSGKSTLINQTLIRGLRRKLHGSKLRPGKHKSLLGLSSIDKVIEIDQSPIGRTPRSNPATYTGVFDQVRTLFTQTREAKIRGYKPGRFSFNVKGGRCEACQGQGVKRIEMHFLPDVYVTCQECKGSRYNRETLEIKYKGKTIADVLAMRIEEALNFFESFPKIKQMLRALSDVGLSYVELGQSSTTLSGGEAQRVKLASELGKRSTGHTLYVLDEPTTGLHFADIHKLMDVLNRLADHGNTVLIIEHNLDVIKCADWIIDLGPEGGDGGGEIIAEGTPEEIIAHPTSHTGIYLKRHLEIQGNANA